MVTSSSSQAFSPKPSLQSPKSLIIFQLVLVTIAIMACHTSDMFCQKSSISAKRVVNLFLILYFQSGFAPASCPWSSAPGKSWPAAAAGSESEPKHLSLTSSLLPLLTSNQRTSSLPLEDTLLTSPPLQLQLHQRPFSDILGHLSRVPIKEARASPPPSAAPPPAKNKEGGQSRGPETSPPYLLLSRRLAPLSAGP